VSDPLLPEGSVSIYRGVFDGRVCYERAARVLSSDRHSATFAWWPGCPTRTVADYVKMLPTDRAAARRKYLEALARRDWELADTPWQHTGVVEHVVSGQWFSVWRMHGEDGAGLGWYVNFSRPPVWRPDGWDSADLALDLEVDPDGSWQWKDEDEYEHSRRLGLISEAEHKAVQAARGEALAALDARSGLFASDPNHRWRPDPTWPTPTLP
jgi:predicted RNA-binding protein associated with RNAse of E/G family